MKVLELLNSGLHAIAHEMKMNRESKETDKLLGWTPDEDKIRLLKADLYRATRGEANPDKIFQLQQSIETLSKQIELKRKRDTSLYTIMHEGAKCILFLTAIATLGSYIIQSSGRCLYVNSEFCRQSRIIPNAVERYFFNEPALVQPTEPNVNIDQSK